MSTKSFDSVWDAISDNSIEAAHMRLRSEIMQQIVAIVAPLGLPQAEAAKKCGITQPRLNNLLKGKISKFSLDALVKIATKLGRHIHITLQAA
jgi:predicted XRE-type DNA-binding protein